MLSRKGLVPKSRRGGLWHGRQEDFPFGPFHREFERMFENFWRGFDFPMFSRLERYVEPRMDFHEDEERFLITVELPGMDEDDIDVTLVEDMLTVKGEKKLEREEKEEDYSFMERSYGTFQRRIPLHSEVLTDKVTARFDKGLLTIELPKTPAAKKAYRRVPINVTPRVKKLTRAKAA